MNNIEQKYEVEYRTNTAGDKIAWLFIDGKPSHYVNVDHLIWEHFYKNGWTK